MRSFQKILFLLFVLQVTKCSCACRETYTVTCDTPLDLENYNKQEWSELVIGSVSESCVVNSRPLHYRLLRKVLNLRRLTIIGQLQLNKTGYGLHTTPWTQLNSLVLYKNNIDTIGKIAFPGSLRELILVDNNIKNLEEYAFFLLGIEFIDLSHNLLDTIKRKVFGNGTKTVVLKNNNIVYIADDAFADTLTTLKLDNNKLVHLQTQIFNNLPNLKELTLSHNNIYKMVTLPTLEKLIKIDLSFNQLERINDNHFRQLPRLEVLDLNNNKISNASVLNRVPSNSSSVQINLSFNLLRRLERRRGGTSSPILTLYGNPWDCDSWHEFEKFMAKNHFERNPCDVRLFGSGNMPYCINYTKEYYPSRKTEHFLAVLDRKKNSLPCDLSPEKYDLMFEEDVPEG